MCTYESVPFDLVLIDENLTDEKSKSLYKGVVDVEQFLSNDPDNLQKRESFIRAMKYWVKRSVIELKSYKIEQLVSSLNE